MTGDAWLDQTPFPLPRLAGLARNPATPVEVLLELLARWPEHAGAWLRRRRDLPPPVQEAMLRHPSPRIRGALASHPQVDPMLRAALLDDEQWMVRTRAFGQKEQRPLPDDVLVRLMATFDQPPPDMPFTREELFGELFEGVRFDRRLPRLAAGHPRPGVRRFAAGFLQMLDEPSQRALLEDPEPEVSAAAAESVAYQRQVMQPADLPEYHSHGFWIVLQRPLSRELINQVLATDDVEAIAAVAENVTTPPEVVETLVGHPSSEVRRCVAARTDLIGEQLARLAADPEAEVRTVVSTHPALTEAQRAAIDIDLATVPCDGFFGHPDHPCHLHYHFGGPVAQLADAIHHARSVNPLLRRSAARNAELPADAVAVLAGDSDLGVRVLLAQHHPAAPPDLILQCFLEYHGCGRARLAERPQFPAVGLAGYADDPDPAVRRLVARDPHAAPELIDRLSTDPDATVRSAMAACPRLPQPRITELLDHPELAEEAAANPALPTVQMRQIIEESSP